MRYRIEIELKGARLETISQKVHTAFGDENVRLVQKVEPPTSRADRLAVAGGQIEEAMGVVEELRDEMQNWYDNLPENFQSGQKGDEIQEAVSALEEIQGNLESCDVSSVSFPDVLGGAGC